MIRIFLASSLTELKDERVILADYINNTVAPILKNADLHLRLFKCEDDPSGNIGGSSQKSIDEELKESDVSVFLFKKKAGEKTLREFDLARELQKTRKHEIYVYCFEVPENDKSQELVEFQRRLEKEGFYWEACDNMDAVKSRFLPGLLKHLFGEKAVSDAQQISVIEKDGEERIKEYESNEESQTQLRKRIHQDIEDLLKQIETTMADNDTNIAIRIATALELFKKADLWASRTDYDKEKYIFLLSGYASFLEDYGLYNEAEVIYLRQVSLVEQCYGERHPNTATLYSNIGGLYWHKGEYDKALEYSFKALRIRESLPDTDGRELATTFNNIGTIYDDLGDYQKALEYYNKAFRLVEHQPYAEGRNYAALCNNIGIVYRKIGNHIEALKYLLIALDASKKVFGKDYPYTASTLNNIGQVYESFGTHDEALKYHEEALGINIENLGVDHPNVGKDYNDIGFVYANMNNYAKALELYKKALKIKHNKLGDEHPDTATCYHNIGYVYYQMKDFEKAVENLSKALVTRKRMLGVDHPDTAATKLLLNAVMFAKTFKR